MPGDTTELVVEAVRRAGADGAVLTGADSVCWASGHVVPIETGASPFAGGPTTAIVGADGVTALVVPDNDDTTGSFADHIVTYVGFSAGDPEPLVANYLAAVEEARSLVGLRRGTAAVEFATLPHSVAQSLATAGVGLVDAAGQFAVSRAIKTDRELRLLRESGRLASLAQSVVTETAEAGMTELELFSRLRLAVESGADGRVAFAGDLVSGRRRTAAVGGWPTSRVLEEGDLVLADLAPRVAGYWADSCNTLVIGQASAPQRRMHAAVASALEVAIQTAQPGTPVNVVDAAVRAALARDGFHYPHHTGHGIGTSVHEYPRVIPGETAELAPGMVILLEPGAYDGDIGGVRLERMLEVTDAGPVVLTPFGMQLSGSA